MKEMICWILGLGTITTIIFILISTFLFPETWEAIDEKIADKIRGEK